MSKVRVYQLAKELGTNSKALSERLKVDGVRVRSASSTLEPDVVRRYRTAYENDEPSAAGEISAPPKNTDNLSTTWRVATRCGGEELPAYPLPPGDRVDVQGCPCGTQIHRARDLQSRHVETAFPPPTPASAPAEATTPPHASVDSSQDEPAAKAGFRTGNDRPPITPRLHKTPTPSIASAPPAPPARGLPIRRFKGREWVRLADLAAALREPTQDIEFDLRQRRARLQTVRHRRGGKHGKETLVASQDAQSLLNWHRGASAPHPLPARHDAAQRRALDASGPDPTAHATSRTISSTPLPEDGLPATPRALATQLGVPVGEVLRRLNAAKIPVRIPDELIPAELRRLAQALAAERPIAPPEYPTTSVNPATPATPDAGQIDAGKGLGVSVGERLHRDRVNDLRANLHRHPPPGHGAAVRSTRATVTFWAHEDALDALTTVETPNGSPLDLGFTPPAGWLLFAQCTDRAGQIGAGSVRGLSWQWVPGGSEVEAFLWHSPDPADDGHKPAHPFTFRLDEPWPTDPEHNLLARWWKLLSTGWIDPEPQPADPPHDRPDPTPLPASRDRPPPSEVACRKSSGLLTQ